MKEKLFLTWQDPESRRWFPVGELRRSGDEFSFRYLAGAAVANKVAGFQPLASFPDFAAEYISLKLFPAFMNRVLPSSRPDYVEYISYLGKRNSDPFRFLGATGGAKSTDTFRLFAEPRLKSGWYHLSFFAHGLRYMPASSAERISTLQASERLFIMHDFENSVDKCALLLRTEDNFNVGYCPAYYLDDLRHLIGVEEGIRATVARVNSQTAPLQFRLMCRLEFRADLVPRPFTEGHFAALSMTHSVFADQPGKLLRPEF